MVVSAAGTHGKRCRLSFFWDRGSSSHQRRLSLQHNRGFFAFRSMAYVSRDTLDVLSFLASSFNTQTNQMQEQMQVFCSLQPMTFFRIIHFTCDTSISDTAGTALQQIRSPSLTDFALAYWEHVHIPEKQKKPIFNQYEAPMGDLLKQSISLISS